MLYTCYDTIASTYDVKAKEDRELYYKRGKGDFVLLPFASTFSDLNRVVLSFDTRSEFVPFAFDGKIFSREYVDLLPMERLFSNTTILTDAQKKKKEGTRADRNTKMQKRVF